MIIRTPNASGYNNIFASCYIYISTREGAGFVNPHCVTPWVAQRSDGKCATAQPGHSTTHRTARPQRRPTTVTPLKQHLAAAKAWHRSYKQPGD